MVVTYSSSTIGTFESGHVFGISSSSYLGVSYCLCFLSAFAATSFGKSCFFDLGSLILSDFPCSASSFCHFLQFSIFQSYFCSCQCSNFSSSYYSSNLLVAIKVCFRTRKYSLYPSSCPP